MRKCNDCGVQPGEEHHEGCDVARCTRTGEQRLAGHAVHDVECHCALDIWTGEWPGVAECKEFDWYAYFVPYGNPSWVRCTADHPEARPDLNRLMVEARWNAETQRWTRGDSEQ